MEGSNAKPLIIARYDFINEITSVINKCNLPAFIIESILKDFYNDVRDIANKQLATELQHYHAQQDNPEKSGV